MTRLARITLAAFVITLLSVPHGFGQSSPDKLSSQKKELEKIENDIKRHRAKAQQLQREEKDMVKKLQHVDQEISLSKKFIRELAERERLLEEQIDGLSANIIVEEGMLDYQRARLSKRVRQMYMQGSSFEWEVVLSASDMQDAMRKYKFLGMVAERDAGLITQVSERKLTLQREQAELTEAMAEVVTLKSTKVDEDLRLRENKEQRVAMLGNIRGEKSQQDKAIAELKRSQEQMRDLIAALERKRLSDDDLELPGGDFAKLKGKLVWPVKGKVTTRFGNQKHPQFGTVTFNNGINIEASSGSPIRAVATGRVEFVDWIGGYGNCIILNHGGGYYTLYAHASEIFVDPGQMVARQDVIAEVGDSGSLNGFECHFEVRKSKQALDPLAWLAKRPGS